jgi:hypothetical protein
LALFLAALQLGNASALLSQPPGDDVYSWLDSRILSLTKFFIAAAVLRCYPALEAIDRHIGFQHRSLNLALQTGAIGEGAVDVAPHFVLAGLGLVLIAIGRILADASGRGRRRAKPEAWDWFGLVGHGRRCDDLDGDKSAE